MRLGADAVTGGTMHPNGGTPLATEKEQQQEQAPGAPGSSDMAARAIWKGHLRLSLVTIPIRVFPATNSSADIRFNQLHRVCETRIQYKKWCPHCEREVSNS
jgi:hypothetical protein